MYYADYATCNSIVSAIKSSADTICILLVMSCTDPLIRMPRVFQVKSLCINNADLIKHGANIYALMYKYVCVNLHMSTRDIFR